MPYTADANAVLQGVKIMSDIIFSMSDVEKTTSDIVFFISDIIPPAWNAPCSM